MNGLLNSDGAIDWGRIRSNMCYDAVVTGGSEPAEAEREADEAIAELKRECQETGTIKVWAEPATDVGWCDSDDPVSWGEAHNIEGEFDFTAPNALSSESEANLPLEACELLSAQQADAERDADQLRRERVSQEKELLEVPAWRESAERAPESGVETVAATPLNPQQLGTRANNSSGS